jgi:hypothetical protein
MSEIVRDWQPPRLRPDIELAGKFTVGQLVLVHESGGLDLTDTPKCGISGMRQIHHDCFKHDHWISRVVGWNQFQRLPMIATRIRFPDGTTGNPNNAEWTWTEDSLEPIKIEDWAIHSTYKPGDKIVFEWNGGDGYEPPKYLHYPAGTLLESVIEIAHIGRGDWYVSFPVKGHRTVDGGYVSDWRFKRVVNEREFIGGSPCLPKQPLALGSQTS